MPRDRETVSLPHGDRPRPSSFVLGNAYSSKPAIEPDGTTGHEGRGRTRGVLPAVMAIAALFAGCAHTPTLTDSERTAIYERADIHFERTVLVKPVESERREFKFAPLLVQQVSGTNVVLSSPYSVYFWKTRARGTGSVLDQFNYLWFHEGAENGKKIPQGVRITFDSSGKPILWEILHDPSGVRLLFVSQSIEAAAMTNYPAPLPERRFWVERSREETPNLLVARIIDDGPAPMGPIVYLGQDSHRVSTLICRCMDAQAKEVVGVAVYGLATLDDAAVRWLSRDKTPGLMRWLPGRPPDDLSQWLRAEIR